MNKNRAITGTLIARKLVRTSTKAEKPEKNLQIDDQKRVNTLLKCDSRLLYVEIKLKVRKMIQLCALADNSNQPSKIHKTIFFTLVLVFKKFSEQTVFPVQKTRRMSFRNNQEVVFVQKPVFQSEKITTLIELTFKLKPKKH